MSPTQKHAKKLKIGLTKLITLDIANSPADTAQRLLTLVAKWLSDNRLTDASFNVMGQDDYGGPGCELSAEVDKTDDELQKEIDKIASQQKKVLDRERQEYERLRQKFEK